MCGQAANVRQQLNVDSMSYMKQKRHLPVDLSSMYDPFNTWFCCHVERNISSIRRLPKHVGKRVEWIHEIVEWDTDNDGCGVYGVTRGVADLIVSHAAQ